LNPATISFVDILVSTADTHTIVLGGSAGNVPCRSHFTNFVTALHQEQTP
jgi:hypothetical protein